MFGPIIRGRGVILRPLRRSDAPNFCRWLADPEVTRFLQRHENPPTRREQLRYITNQGRRQDTVHWAINTSDGIHIGSTSLMKVDRDQRHAEFGIFIGDPRYWGQGLGTQAGSLVVRYGFGTLKLHRIYLEVYVYNTRGIRSYRRLGFRPEGRLRDHLYRGHNFHDVMIMGMLRAEFPKSVKRKAKMQNHNPKRKVF